MSYPPPVYPGESGELTATLRRASRPPDLTFGGNGAAHYLATGAGTNGQFGLYLWEMGPVPSGPAAHFHRSISESFYVLSGSVRFYDGKDWSEGRPGDFLFIPEGGIHAFRNESGEPASMLLLFAPGAPREGYFEGLPALASMSDAERTEFFVNHDTYWV